MSQSTYSLENQSESPYLLTLPDLLSAKKKLSRVAAFYDPMKMGLDGFECEYLNPTEFREQLRRNLIVQLTNAELGALVVWFDKDGVSKVSTKAFISEFLKLGQAERDRLKRVNKEVTTKIKKKQVKSQEARRQKNESLAFVPIPKTWSEKEKESAEKKFAFIAFSFDSQKNDCLKGFTDGGSLTPIQFREQVKRNFQVRLTPAETSALCSKFDSNGDGKIDCDEFLYQFFRTGREERDRFRQKKLEESAKLRDKEKRRALQIEKKFLDAISVHLKSPRDECFSNISQKIKDVAVNYEPYSNWGDDLIAFQAAAMSATELKGILHRVFRIKASDEEISAIIKRFPYQETTDSLDCPAFLAYFFAEGKKEKERQFVQKMKREASIHRKKHAFDEQLERKMTSQLSTAIEWPDLPETNVHQQTASLESSLSLTRFDTTDSSSLQRKEKRSRKPSVMDSISPNHRLLQKYTDSSMLTIFKNISDSTKSFLQEIEEKETEIKNLKKVK